VKTTIGALIIAFVWLETSGRLERLGVSGRHLVVGGLLSGFFGGLSGNQGAFRSGFLLTAGLDKRAFVGTSVVCAVVVDVARLAVYGLSGVGSREPGLPGPVVGVIVAAIASAFLGAWVGTRMLERVTLRAVHLAVATLLSLVGAGLLTGVL
jgi:uncharacterized membrane protein YfcA